MGTLTEFGRDDEARERLIAGLTSEEAMLRLSSLLALQSGSLGRGPEIRGSTMPTASKTSSDTASE